MKKILIVMLALLLTFTMLIGCDNGNSTPTENKSINVIMLDGAPLLTMTKMRADNYAVMDDYTINYTTVADSNALTAQLMNKEPDFAIAPINLAAMMHTNGSGYRLAGVTIWGIMHIVSNQAVTTLDELKGETVFAFAKSGTPGITLRAVLEQNDIKYVEDKGGSYAVKSDEVHIVYLAGAADVRNAIVVGNLDGIAVKFGVLAEPVATAIAGATASATHGQFTAKINLQTEWAKNNDGQIFPQAGLIFHERLLENNKEFVDKFISMVELSAIYAQANPKTVGDMAVEMGSTAIPNGTIMQNASNAGRLPLNFVYATQAKQAVEDYLQVIYDETPTLIGGSMPAETFFYQG